MAQEQPDSSTNWQDVGKQILANSISGAFVGAALNGCVFKMDTTTDIPVDPTLTREKISLVQTDRSLYAALQTESGGVQVFTNFNNEKMQIIEDPHLAKNIADQIARYIPKNNGPIRVLEAQTDQVSMPFVLDDDYPPVRNIPMSRQQATPTLNLRKVESVQFWSEISASIANGQYDIPARETLPIGEYSGTFMREGTNPKALALGALGMNFLVAGLMVYARRQEKTEAKKKRTPDAGAGNAAPSPETPANDAQTLVAPTTTDPSTGRTATPTQPRRTSYASQSDMPGNRKSGDDDTMTSILTAAAVYHVATSNNNNNGGHTPQENHATNHSESSHGSSHDHSPGGSD